MGNLDTVMFKDQSSIPLRFRMIKNIKDPRERIHISLIFSGMSMFKFYTQDNFSSAREGSATLKILQILIAGQVTYV